MKLAILNISITSKVEFNSGIRNQNRHKHTRLRKIHLHMLRPPYKQDMSNVNASEENTESPSTYANDAYKEFRKKEKEKPKDESTQ